MVQVSLFASAVRPQLWPALFKSFEGISCNYEVIFSGNTPPASKSIGEYFKYIKTSAIKPAQCYEIARRHCTGETVVWVADDCEFVGDILGKAYAYWKSQGDKKLILSLQTKETGYGQKDGRLYPMHEHTFYALMPDTPLMAPIAMMSREYLEELGGIDRRYVCGQYENDIIMRAYADGAHVEIIGNEHMYVDIDHLAKSIAIGESTNEEDFRDRPFAKGYGKDRDVLETSWTTFNPAEAFKRLEAGERPHSLRKMSMVQLDQFEPYAKDISLTESESNKGHWQ